MPPGTMLVSNSMVSRVFQPTLLLTDFAICSFPRLCAGDMKFNRSSRCPCKNGPICNDCNYCLGCSCRCHSWFTLNCRLFNKDTEQEILQRVETAVKTWKESEDGDTDKYLDDEGFTMKRLDAAKRNWGHDDERIL
jgi:hypothetical protein